MNSRNRFLEIAKFERKYDPMWFSIQAWYETYVRWQNEGMPVKSLNNFKEINMHFLGYGSHYEVLIPIASMIALGPLGNPPYAPPLVPSFKEIILEEDEKTLTKIDYDGAKVKILKDNPRSFPLYIEFPVKDRKSWNEFKKRLNPFSKERFPKEWNIMTNKTVTQWPLKKN